MERRCVRVSLWKVDVEVMVIVTFDYSSPLHVEIRLMVWDFVDVLALVYCVLSEVRITELIFGCSFR